MGLQDDINEANKKVEENDRIIAYLTAAGFIRQMHPQAVMVWGNENGTLPDPDGFGQVWQLPATEDNIYIVVEATQGEAGLRLITPQNRRWNKMYAGTRPYLFYAFNRLKQNGVQELAKILEQELIADRLLYWEVVVQIDYEQKPLDIKILHREFDISGDADVAAAIRAVQNGDISKIEDARQIFSLGALKKLTEYYWQCKDWEKKINLVYIMMDNHHPLTKPVMEDALNIPENITHDGARWARTVALTHLEGTDKFAFYYEDDERTKAAIAEHRAKNKHQGLDNVN